MLADIITIAKQAGETILPYFHDQNSWKMTQKEDQTPLTEADLASNQLILKCLEELTPDIPILSEEAEISYPIRQDWETFWLVDPLDGTKEFIHGRPEFTVNIALIENQAPILGVILAPVLGLCYSAERGQGAFCNDKLLVNRHYNRDPIAAVSHSYGGGPTEQFLNQHQISQVLRIGSALKFGRLAEGTVDLYPRFSPCKEWDIAAGHLIITEAGCTLQNFETGLPPVYNKADLYCTPFIAQREGLNLQ